MARSGWRELLADQVAVQAAEVRERNPGASDVAHISRVGFSVQAHHYLIKAVRKRNISIAGYIRRAVMTMVAIDLGMNRTDLFEMDTAILPVGRGGAPSRDLDEVLYGKWEVHSGESCSERD